MSDQCSSLFGNNSRKKFLQNVKTYALAITAFHSAAVLFGAPLYNEILKTLGFAVLMASIVVIPMMIRRELTPLDALQLLLDARSPDQQRALLTILGAWLGAFVIPLDWDRPWQEWPIPCCSGAVIGAMAFYVMSLISFFVGTQTRPSGVNK